MQNYPFREREIMGLHNKSNLNAGVIWTKMKTITHGGGVLSEI